VGCRRALRLFNGAATTEFLTWRRKRRKRKRRRRRRRRRIHAKQQEMGVFCYHDPCIYSTVFHGDAAHQFLIHSVLHR
jgi:hypothetical protein